MAKIISLSALGDITSILTQPEVLTVGSSAFSGFIAAFDNLSTAQRKSLLTSLNLNDTLLTEILTRSNLSTEVKDNIIDLFAENGVKKINNDITGEGTAANTKYALSFKNVATGARASIKALAAAHPVMTMLIGLAASMLIFAKIYDALNVSFEELQKAYFEAKKAPKNEVYIEIVTENFEKVKGLVSAVTDALGEVGTGSSVFIEAVFCLYMLFEE